MKIGTRYLGQVEIDEEDIVVFENGLPGFEDRTRFILLDLDETRMIRVLQDVDDKNLAFLLVNPWDFFQDYDIEIEDSLVYNREGRSLEDLKKDIAIYSIVRLGEDLESSTCNLLAPVVINKLKKQGRQVILSGSPYKTKHRLFAEEEGLC